MSTYERSQSVTAVRLPPVSNAPTLARAILTAPDAVARQERGQRLLDALSEALRMPSCGLVVADRRQRHRTQGGRLTSKTYGYYRCDFRQGSVHNASIRIYNRTAIREQVLGPRVFLETLLHEWVHHYDFAALKLRRSPHTSGFFSRVRSVAEALEVAFVVPPSREEGNGERRPAVLRGEWRPLPPPPAIVAAIRRILARRQH